MKKYNLNEMRELAGITDDINEEADLEQLHTIFQPEFLKKAGRLARSTGQNLRAAIKDAIDAALSGPHPFPGNYGERGNYGDPLS